MAPMCAELGRQIGLGQGAAVALLLLLHGASALLNVHVRLPNLFGELDQGFYRDAPGQAGGAGSGSGK